MRNSLPNARIMIHQPSGGVRGQATDIQIQAEEIVKIKKQINSLYVKHTGLPMETVEKSMERDKFMNPEEAKQFGIIDNVMAHVVGEDGKPKKKIRVTKVPIKPSPSQPSLL